jgi:hypothetical protein
VAPAALLHALLLQVVALPFLLLACAPPLVACRGEGLACRAAARVPVPTRIDPYRQPLSSSTLTTPTLCAV